MNNFSNELADILVFKTDIKFKKDLKAISTCIKQDQRIKEWSVDIEDIDKVLRIESMGLQPCEVIRLLQTIGVYCEEMQD